MPYTPKGSSAPIESATAWTVCQRLSASAPVAVTTTAESPQSAMWIPGRSARPGRSSWAGRSSRTGQSSRSISGRRSSCVAVQYVRERGDLDARVHQCGTYGAGARDGAGGVTVQQDGVALDRDVVAAHGPDDALGHHADGAPRDLLRGGDDRAGLAARHQGAVVLVGTVGDADDADPKAAFARRRGELTVLGEDDDRLVEEAIASTTARA